MERTQYNAGLEVEVPRTHGMLRPLEGEGALSSHVSPLMPTWDLVLHSCEVNLGVGPCQEVNSDLLQQQRETDAAYFSLKIIFWTGVGVH